MKFHDQPITDISAIFRTLGWELYIVDVSEDEEPVSEYVYQARSLAGRFITGRDFVDVVGAVMIEVGRNWQTGEVSVQDGVVQPGVCRVCGCTGETPCIDQDGQPCYWVDEDRTLCSACQPAAEDDGGERDQEDRPPDEEAPE